jgi:fimbrial chaperone protein
MRLDGAVVRSKTPREVLPWIAAAVLALAAAGKPAAASTFTIAPIRVDLDAAHPTQVLTLRNEEDVPVLVQVQVVEWQQQDGVDRFAETRDVLMTPPVLTLDPHGSRLLRVALRRNVDPVRELSYRLILQEVPQASPSELGRLKLALRLSLPVFVSPAQVPDDPAIQWGFQWLDDRSLRLEAFNAGVAHAQLRNLRIALGTGPPLQIDARYVLPGSAAHWVLAQPGGTERPRRIRIEGESDEGAFTADLVAFAPAP